MANEPEAQEPTEELGVKELRERAAELEIKGRSNMDKDQLIAAIEAAENEPVLDDAPVDDGLQPKRVSDTTPVTPAVLESLKNAIANARS